MCLWIFRKKYPVISSLYGQHTDTAEDIHISTIGFEGNPKEWYISMRIYGEKFDDLLHGNLLMNVAFAPAVGNLCTGKRGSVLEYGYQHSPINGLC